MAITFSYTESTNTVIVTEGTSGTPATFADFVVADRAGVGTSLLDASNPSSSLTLTYQVRPVENIAIKVKCAVANKTTEADYIFIIGKDWLSAAQTESIDISAGNGTYESTKYWSEISTLDCSDAATGSGTIWADGDLAVAQDIWGVIWNCREGIYEIDSKYDIGDGSTSTYFSTEQETIIFNAEMRTRVNATFRSGIYNSGSTYNGSNLIINWTNGGWFDWYGTIEWYDTRFESIAIKPKIRFRSTSIQKFQDFTLAGEYQFYHAHSNSGGFLERIRAVVGPLYTQYISPVGGAVNDVLFDGMYQGPEFAGFTPDQQKFYALTTKNIAGAPNLQLGFLSNITLYLIDCFIEDWADIVWDSITNSGFYRQYSINIYITDKDGNNLSGVTVDCDDKDNNNVFGVNTAADGTITEQEVSYRRYWYDGSEVITNYSPHKFSFSKQGYKTLVLENITIDGIINWHLTLDNPIGPMDKPWR